MCSVQRILNKARDFKKDNPNKDGFDLYNKFDTLNEIKKLDASEREFAQKEILKIFKVDPDYLPSIQMEDRVGEWILSEEKMEETSKSLKQSLKDRGL